MRLDMRLDRHLILPVEFLVALLVALFWGAALATASSARAEVPNQPMWSLRQSAFELEVTVLSVEEKAGPGPQDTSVWHRVRVDHVVRSDGLKPGDETAVVSKVHELPANTVGSRGQRGPFRGLNGLPVKGDRARLFANGSAKILQPAFPNGWQPIEPQIAFVAADDEYRSEVTLPFLAAIVQKPLGVKASIHLASEDGTTPKVEAKTNLTDARAIGRADLIVAYMRFEQLEQAARMNFLDPLEHGIPLVAFRTTTHAFGYPAGSPDEPLNAGFGERFLGTPWRFHHGHSSKTRVLPPTDEAAKHPILAGVGIPAEGIVVPSWLYHVEPLPADCRVLLWGEAIDSERKDAPQKQPILWVREQPPPQEVRGGSSPPRLQRIAVTTLGHPGDFERPEVRLVAVQMIAWANERMHVLDDAKRKAIRDAAFTAPATR
ncbi:MAG: hypothetical protein RL591_1618 [Planctomycetota bacterium]|jgi:hypothetical protein